MSRFRSAVVLAALLFLPALPLAQPAADEWITPLDGTTCARAESSRFSPRLASSNSAVYESDCSDTELRPCRYTNTNAGAAITTLRRW